MLPQNSIRKPAVAGQFYPSNAKDINAMISSFADKGAQKNDVIGCVLPHAGYVYSGKVAVATISRVNIKNTVVLLGPNHTGLGADFSIMPQGTWQTPLGNVEINSELANSFLSKSAYLEADTIAHLDEHSLEVELPILQYFRRDFKIVPIAIKIGDLSALNEIAQSLAGGINEIGLKSSVIFIASSDMTHYEPQKSAEKKDNLAIEAICALDEQRLESTIKKFDISMCGFAPVAVLIKAAKILGAKAGKLIKYQTSADATKDTSSVVGYAGITIY
ncbi:MAG: AmmeMemoRadiSam system protein B [Candidatus Omnitrophica bacterium]|nr:AmmeMemoRadiSam system protein B [Candidatus Omnitrophota bacterium]